MSYEFYKVLHICGLLLVFTGLAGALALAINKSTVTTKTKKFVSLTHGIGLLIMLTAGFGLAARLNYMGAWPNWLTVKIIIWFLLGGLLAFANRKPAWAWYIFSAIILLGTCAAYLAINKPF